MGPRLCLYSRLRAVNVAEGEQMHQYAKRQMPNISHPVQCERSRLIQHRFPAASPATQLPPEDHSPDTADIDTAVSAGTQDAKQKGDI